MSARTYTTRQAGFTLVELIIVIGMMVMLAGIALPSVAQLFRGGAFPRARNVLSTQLAMARAIAVRHRGYAGVHVQPADAVGDDELRNTVWSAIVVDLDGDGEFTQRDGDEAARLPGHVGFGALGTPDVLDGDSYDAAGLSDAGLEDFAGFTIVFSPTGRLVTQVEGHDITFDAAAPAFSGDSRIWTRPAGEGGAQALTVFDYAQLRVLSPADRAEALNEAGMYIGLNPYNGQLLAPQ